jgi:uncharacterized protein
MSILSCPVCQGAMREIAKEGVLIDTCTQCRGVWLDRGELEKIVGFVDRQAPEPRSRAAPDRGDRGERYADDSRGRRRGWGDGDDDDDDDYDRRAGDLGDGPRRSRMSRLMDFFD